MYLKVDKATRKRKERQRESGNSLQVCQEKGRPKDKNGQNSHPCDHQIEDPNITPDPEGAIGAEAGKAEVGDGVHEEER